MLQKLKRKARTQMNRKASSLALSASWRTVVAIFISSDDDFTVDDGFDIVVRATYSTKSLSLRDLTLNL